MGNLGAFESEDLIKPQKNLIKSQKPDRI